MKVRFVFGLLAIMTVIVSCNSTKFTGIVASLPDMNTKSNGTYRGNYSLSGTPVKVTLDVTVMDGTIVDIKIIQHICSPIGKKAEKTTERIISEQSLAIDGISGATGSSKAILKAVEVALQM
jgi:uncharacterized protein with FMN-binding domain